MNKEIVGIYVHWPECQHRCPYCDFVTFDQHRIQSYLESYKETLKQHLSKIEPFLQNRFWSLYLGGGTPSLLNARYWAEILSPLLENHGGYLIEFTLEANPETVNKLDFNLWLDLGLSRISLGVQSFQDFYLKVLGRNHSSETVFKALDVITQNPVKVSVDLMYGLPYQKVTNWLHDLEILTKWPLHHVSCYNLTVHDEHELNRYRPTDDEQNEMFQVTIDFLSSAGYRFYELSNWALPNHECVHNLNYWHQGEYWGVGLSGAGFWPKQGRFGIRHWCPTDWLQYQKLVENWNPMDDQPNHGWLVNFQESLTLPAALTEFFLMHFRLVDGWKWSRFMSFFGQIEGLDQWIWEKLVVLERQGFVEKEALVNDYMWKIKRDKLFVSNQVFRRLTFLPDDLPMDLITFESNNCGNTMLT